MVLSTEWCQVEVIDLVNDGSGLGFGIVGGRSTGVVIKSILPGGIADKDSRLQSGDHILQIGEVSLTGFSADQVASVLRQAGTRVRMVVARPIEHTSADFEDIVCSAPIVPTKILTDPEELDRQLVENGYSACCNYIVRDRIEEQEETYEDEQVTHIEINAIESNGNINSPTMINSRSLDIEKINTNTGNTPNCDTPSPRASSCRELQLPVVTESLDLIVPNTKRFTIELVKKDCGLGITVAGYVCEREDLNGIFVKSINEGGAAYKCEQIKLNDRIVEVDGQSLQGLTNHHAVEKLKQTGEVVKLTLERYLNGPKFEHLLEAISGQEERDISPPSPSVTTLSWIPIDSLQTPIDAEAGSETSAASDADNQNSENKEIFIEENFEVNPEADLETAIKKKWESIIGTDTEIVVANLTKLKGLGISLEGTVDVEGGIELRPHHYIRSILPEGPVGQNGKLSSGDELLEVNGQRLLGIRHVEVVKILRELPSTVRLVCARTNDDNRVINTSQDREAFEARNILGGSLKNLLSQPEPRLVKALSDSSLATSSTVTIEDEMSPVMVHSRSRSLELSTVAMWSERVDTVELVKGPVGLGFSILDYQDPLDMTSTVIVVRSLIPGGPAELDGRITPGDRLVSVEGKDVSNASLDEAVKAIKAVPLGKVKLGIAKPLPSAYRTSDGF